MMLLPNGCRCSNPKITPANYKAKLALSSSWYISYRFYDPLFKDKYPNGRFIIVKRGLNYYKDHAEKIDAAEIILKATIQDLKFNGYNPITKKCIKPYEPTYIIDPETPILIALAAARKRLSKLEKSTLGDIDSVLKYVTLSIKQLRFDELPVNAIQRKHMRAVLDNCNKSPNRTNKYKNYLSILFEELIEMETIEHNPVSKIKKQKIIKRVRPTLSLEERQEIDQELKKKDYNFWRFMHIFFHSGARITELFRLKVSDVNLKEQKIKVLVKKGKMFVEVEKVIKDTAMSFWSELLSNECKQSDYVFSKKFVPGQTKSNTDHVNKLWYKHVKDTENGLGIEKDFYSLKHLHTTEVSALLGKEKAAEHNSHTTTKMVEQVYDVEFKNRESQEVKTLNNAFA